MIFALLAIKMFLLLAATALTVKLQTIPGAGNEPAVFWCRLMF